MAIRRHCCRKTAAASVSLTQTASSLDGFCARRDCFTFQSFIGCLRDWCRSYPHIPIDFKQYEITGSRLQILRELALMGITGGTLFDDLDYMAKDIVDAERAMASQRMGT